VLIEDLLPLAGKMQVVFGQPLERAHQGGHILLGQQAPPSQAAQ
jgi:hypothetical protein